MHSGYARDRGAAAVMTSLAQLENYTNELSAAVKTLANHSRNVEDSSVDFAGGSPPKPLLRPDAPSEAHRARRSVLSVVAKLQTLLGEPADFLQQLSRQVLPISSHEPSCRADSMFCRINSLPASSGLANSKYWPAYPSIAASRSRMSLTSPAFQRRNYAALYG